MPDEKKNNGGLAMEVGSQGHGTHLVILSTIDENGKVVPADHRLAMRNKANQLWHTDSTFKAVPALASVLSARIIPAAGGETEYVSTRLAWDRLDPALQAKLVDSFAWHDYAHSRGQIAPDLASPEERAALPAQRWRMMWKNPVNGRPWPAGEARHMVRTTISATAADGLETMRFPSPQAAE
jgi:alpha-ketoglutarate-dependent 2,4-dichlorophenoxyacetate dioxygenase